MARDSFLFYRSFYEAIHGLARDIQLEVMTAIIEYALDGVEPDNLKPVAKGLFTLIRPIIDANTSRYENGQKGGRKSATANKQTETKYSLTYKQEVEQMRTDEKWKKEVCNDFQISALEFDKRLARFLKHCSDDKKRKGKNQHESFIDAQDHFRFWCTKAYPQQNPSTNNSEQNPSTDYTFNGGFGGMDV